MTDETRQSPTDAASHDDADHMVKIDKLIADLQSIKDRFGNTCVYIRRGGLSWGAVALNRRDDDKKHGVFDLQAQHDRDMVARAGQVERLIEARNRAEQEAGRLRAELSALTMPSRDALIDLIMRETTDDIVADGWERLGKPNILVQGCTYVRRSDSSRPTEGYANPNLAARNFAGLIADAIIKLVGART